jgi:nitric oxide reductase NorQ protein
MTRTQSRETDITQYVIEEEPYYLEVGNEVKLFWAAYREQLPVVLKGPTGCGKTRLVDYMAYHINQEVRKREGKDFNYIVALVAGHEDLAADDLKGRHLMSGEFVSGAAHATITNPHGGMLYLDEIVEARQDTTVVIHPLTDDRRTLMVEKLGKVYSAPPEFMVVLSYNPGYQKKTKNLKISTKQRLVGIEMGYPPNDLEAKIIMHETGADKNLAKQLVAFGDSVRNLVGKGLEEGASTRLLINAAKLIRQEIHPYEACQAAIVSALVDDVDIYKDARKGIMDALDNNIEKP